MARLSSLFCREADNDPLLFRRFGVASSEGTHGARVLVRRSEMADVGATDRALFSMGELQGEPTARALTGWCSDTCTAVHARGHAARTVRGACESFGHDGSQARRLDESPTVRHTTEGVPIAFRYLRKEQRAASGSRG